MSRTREASCFLIVFVLALLAARAMAQPMPGGPPAVGVVRAERQQITQSDEFTGIRCRRLHRNRFELNRFREMRHGCCPADRKRLSRFGDNLAGFKTPNADDEHNEQNRDYRNKDEAECFDHRDLRRELGVKSSSEAERA